MKQNCQACTLAVNATQTLTERGIRITELRRDVLQFLYHNSKPIGAYELFGHLKSDNKASAPPAVYRVLDFLVEQGLVHKLLSISAYTACCLEGHDHKAAFLICRACGQVKEFDNPMPENLASDGFKIEAMSLEATGLCGACQ